MAPYNEKRPNDGYARQKSYEPSIRSGGSRQPPPFAPPSANSLARKPTFTRGPPVHRGATTRRAGAQNGISEEKALPPGLAGQQGTLRLQRGKTLTRPDRFVAPAPLISATPVVPGKKQSEITWFKPWTAFSHVATFWAPPFLLSAFGMRDQAMRQAWREKFALCLIAVMFGGVVGFATIGLNRVLCPSSGNSTPQEFIRLGEEQGFVGIGGWMFNISQSAIPQGVNFYTLSKQLSGIDVTDFFDQSQIPRPACNGLTGAFATTNLCASNTTGGNNPTCPLGPLNTATINSLKIVNTTRQVGWAWEQVSAATNYMVIDGVVLNLSPYIAAHPTPIANDTVDTAIRTVLQTWNPSGGKDATKLFHQRDTLADAAQCMVDRYRAGHIDKITPGCFASQLFLYTSLCVIMGVVLVRFAMAVVFNWFLSRKLVQPPKNLSRRHAVSPAVMPAGANLEVDNKAGTAPWTGQQAKLQRKVEKNGVRPSEKSTGRRAPTAVDADGMINMGAIGAELFCACLVTCYSEGEDSIKGTLDAIAAADYSDARKLMFVVADGMITGSGEKRSTPDICVSLLDADPRFGNPTPMSYLAIGAGKKQHNQALVYAGHYTCVKGKRTPTIIVVKCGTPDEARDKKPGNRGKRDSQMILMNFFSRVTYNDRMTPLDYDLFRKVHALMGVTPDFFEVTLMVDADTRIYRNSITQLVNCMHHDTRIMGVCGETRIANKRDSWVTAIQVYEYFISHHLAKAFESVFGGVTCLPGCFSMYRLKARKDDGSDWVPILVQSEICREYSQSIVTTLHEKNLLLLGEDRFLSTLMIRTFPARKMMFCPQAKCRTVAPDSFKVLLSQRRRWINSTIHNLMELVLVRNLCGTFCFSMQFVVFMELIGTTVLPVAICLTYTLIINYCFNPPKDFGDAIPLLLLAGVLGLPAVLIMITTRKVVYLLWMLIYLLALPIWNFVLPVYAFWHFDDFSWGETRKVQGEGKDLGHGGGAGESIEVNAVPLRRWDAWEKSRLRKMKRDARRRKEFERTFGSKLFHGDQESTMDVETAETASQVSKDDDRYGQMVGQYQDEWSANVPPPTGLFHVDSSETLNAQTFDKDQMNQMLDEGWSDDEGSPNDLKLTMSDAVRYSQVDSTSSPTNYTPTSPYNQNYPEGHYGSSSSLLPARSGTPLRPVPTRQTDSAGSSSQGHSSSGYERHMSHGRQRSSGQAKDFA